MIVSEPVFFQCVLAFTSISHLCSKTIFSSSERSTDEFHLIQVLISLQYLNSRSVLERSIVHNARNRSVPPPPVYLMLNSLDIDRTGGSQPLLPGLSSAFRCLGHDALLRKWLAYTEIRLDWRCLSLRLDVFTVGEAEEPPRFTRN